MLAAARAQGTGAAARVSHCRVMGPASWSLGGDLRGGRLGSSQLLHWCLLLCNTSILVENLKIDKLVSQLP